MTGSGPRCCAPSSCPGWLSTLSSDGLLASASRGDRLTGSAGLAVASSAASLRELRRDHGEDEVARPPTM
jgi:hypothetical protein